MTHLDHYHCLHGCENPQPFQVAIAGDSLGFYWQFPGEHEEGPCVNYKLKDHLEKVRFCGRCWFIDGIKTEMTLCTPELCGE